MVQYFYSIAVRPTLICLIMIGFFLPLLVVASSQSSNANKVVDIDAICLRVPSLKQFCEGFLKSLPAGPGADVFTLAEQTTDVLQTNGTMMINLITKLINETTGDRTDQQFLGCCQESYGGFSGDGSYESVLYFIHQIQQALKSGDYFAVDYFVVAVGDENGYCFKEEEPPKHLAFLQNYSDYIDKAISVLQALLYFLETD